jgi:DNA integrity scanning protein DisA with diadenylate cyclase activity
LHDGAVIIHANRIKAARCILPVTEREELPAEFGLRHRAAIGMSESTDTLVLVVSEETGQMSVVRNGKIFHNLSVKEIRAKINDYLYEEDRTDDLPEKEEEVVATQRKEEKEKSADKSVSAS